MRPRHRSTHAGGRTRSQGGLDASWNFDDVGDFTGDGGSDVLWRNSDGTLAQWVMNGSTITAASAALTFQGAPVTPDGSWQMLA